MNRNLGVNQRQRTVSTEFRSERGEKIGGKVLVPIDGIRGEEDAGVGF